MSAHDKFKNQNGTLPINPGPSPRGEPVPRTWDPRSDVPELPPMLEPENPFKPVPEAPQRGGDSRTIVPPSKRRF